MYPFMKRILLYGINDYACCYLKNFTKSENVVGFLETKKRSNLYFRKKVYELSDLSNLVFDEIHILNSHPETIISLKNSSISLDKIVIPFFLCDEKIENDICYLVKKFSLISQKLLTNYMKLNNNEQDIRVKFIRINPGSFTSPRLNQWCNVVDEFGHKTNRRYSYIIKKYQVPKISPTERIFFNLDVALKEGRFNNFAFVFFMGIGDYFFATQFILQLKNIYSNVTFDAYVGNKNDVNNSKYVYDCLKVNPCFRNVFFFEGSPNEDNWVNYDYENVYSQIIDDKTLVIPLIYLVEPYIKSRYLGLCKTFNIRPQDISPLPKVFLDYPVRDCVQNLISNIDKKNLIHNYKSIIWLQIKSRSYNYFYKQYKELIRLLSDNNYFVICSDQIDYEDENLHVIDQSEFTINDSIRLLGELAKKYKIQGCGVTSCFAAICSGMSIPYLTLHVYFDSGIESVWNHTEKIVTFKAYKEIPASLQFICSNSKFEYKRKNVLYYSYPAKDVFKYLCAEYNQHKGTFVKS